MRSAAARVGCGLAGEGKTAHRCRFGHGQGFGVCSPPLSAAVDRCERPVERYRVHRPDLRSMDWGLNLHRSGTAALVHVYQLVLVHVLILSCPNTLPCSHKGA